MTEQPAPTAQPRGMFAFTIVWLGQLISLLGSAMTGFAMTIWAYEKTGTATALALVGFFFVAPMLAVSPFAGALVDRHSRKLMMIVSDLAAGIGTIIILVLYSLGALEMWHLYVVSAFQGIFQAFQWPAYSSAITTMLSKEHYGRANGMMALAESASGIFAPLMAGALLLWIGFEGILIIDIVTFVLAVSAVLMVHVPQPRQTAEGQQVKGSLLKEAAYGFRYILARPSLLGLQLTFMTANFMIGIPQAIMAAMILARSGSDELVFASVNSAGAIGGVIGGLVMSAWGGTKRKVHGVLAGWFISSLSGAVLMGLGRALPVWAVAAFCTAFFVPIINGSNQAIWQAKVAPDLQGRVFSIRRLIAWFVSPLAMLVAGPLADKVMEPAMQPNGSLVSVFGSLVGTGPGAGMALLFVVFGLAAALVGLGGYLFRPIRDAEIILPDHDQLAPAEYAAAD